MTDETELIGRIILKGNIFKEVNYLLHEDLFDDIKNRLIYGAMKSIRDKNAHIDESSLISELTVLNQLNAVGVDYINDIKVGIKSTTNAELYAKNLVEKYGTRQCKALIKEFDRAIDKGGSIVDIADKYARQIIDASRTSNLGLTEISTLLNDEIDLNKKRIVDNLTGINDLDKAMMAYEKGLIVVTGKSGHGKTGLSANIFHHHFTQDKPCILFSAENSKRVQFVRPLSKIMNIHTQEFKSDRAAITIHESRVKEYKFAKELAASQHGKTYIIDGELTLQKIRHVVQVQKTKGVEVYAIDRLELFKEIRNAKNSIEAQSALINNLRALAVEEQVWLVIYAQMEKDSAKTKGMPTLNSIRGSGEMTTAATIYLTLWLPHKEFITTIEQVGMYIDDLGPWLKMEGTNEFGDSLKLAFFSIQKNTDGGSNIFIPCWWNENHSMFENIKREEVLINNLEELKDLPF